MGTFGWVWNESNEHEAPIITFKMVTNAFDFMLKGLSKGLKIYWKWHFNENFKYTFTYLKPPSLFKFFVF
jgi:hypothetical protein